MMMRWVNLCLLVTLWVTQAHAFTAETMDGEKTMTVQDYIRNSIDDYIDVPKGALDWKLFGLTKEILIDTKTDDGYDLRYSQPDFPPDLKALDGQEIKIKGYMFPLEGNEKQKLFLFGPFPLTCPFQYHVGPPLVLEVHADKHPVKFNYEPITLTGRLELVADDPDYNVFYRLNEAKQTK